ncbi:NnrS family protein [Rubritalea sp.]|uniref:NnrS family protein n=1 Tax=Rubritalea sp. TaxID=2109375 RepID=UPI003EFAB950
MSTKLQLVAAEPYRLFFPMALLAGVVGVMLWPLFYWQCIEFYPVQAHTRLMIEGFVGGYAIGFLGTAMPKMLSAPSLKLWQVMSLVLGYFGYCIAHGAGSNQLGDGIFAVSLSFMLVCFWTRFQKRKSATAPQMVLAVMGILCGVFGAAWWAFFVPSEHFYVTVFAQRLLYQAFILLPILGIGSFFFPMVLGVKKEGIKSTKAWRVKAGESIVVGVLILLTYWVEVHGQQRAMAWTRFLVCFIWLIKESGWLKRTGTKGVMAYSLRAGIVCLLGGMVAIGVLDQQRIALEHTLYIGGFGLIAMIVGTRVIYGHSGQGGEFQSWGKLLVASTALLLLAMATRVSADFMPAIRTTHHIYAAFCWVLVSIIWGFSVFPFIHRRPITVKAKAAAPVKSVLDMNFRKK